MAGMRALAICKQLHGASYDAQSEDDDTQHELLQRINSHRWRVEKKKDLIDSIKFTLMGPKEESHAAKSELNTITEEDSDTEKQE